MRLSVAAALAAALAVAPARAVADDAKPAPTVPGRPKPKKPLPPYKPGPPDRVALLAAEDANLEPAPGYPQGWTLAVGLGPAIQIGIGVEHATGPGGGFSFRIGRAADRSTITYLEATGTVFPYRIVLDDPAMTRRTELNQSILLTAGAQLYVGPTLWLRASAGLAGFTSRVEGGMRDESKSLLGGGISTGAGLELVRRGSFRLTLELLSTGAVYRDGVILGGGAILTLATY